MDGSELFLKAGTALNFETKTAYAVAVSARDPLLPGSTPVSAVFTLAVGDVNEPPTALALANIVTSLAENSNTTSRIKVADIAISDDALGSNVISLAGADASSFEVIGTELFLKAGTALDFETKAAYAVTVSASDTALPGSTPVSAAFTLTVGDVNEPPTALSLSASSFDENIPAGSTVATLVTTDPDVGNTFTYSLVSGSGDSDNGAFSIDGNRLLIQASPDFESKSSFNLRIRSTDQGGLSVEQAVILAVTNLTDGPATFAIAGTRAVGQTLTATVATPDPDGNGTFSHTWQASANGSTWSTIGTGAELTIAPAQEGQQLRLLTAYTDGQGFSESVTTTAGTVPFVNNPPTALALTNTIASLAENTRTASRIKVADIVISDDALGSNVITLAGADAASFEVIGTELFLKAGTTLDFETKSAFAVSVSVSDPSLPDSTPDSATFTLAVSDVNEPPTALALSNTVASLA